MKLFIAEWFDPDDKLIRVAGVYRNDKSALRRVAELGSGAVQTVTLGRPIIFTHEKRTKKQPKIKE